MTTVLFFNLSYLHPLFNIYHKQRDLPSILSKVSLGWLNKIKKNRTTIERHKMQKQTKNKLHMM